MRRWIKLSIWALAGLAVVAGYLVMRPPKMAPPREIRVAATPEALARGKYLYEVVADCDGCHGERNWGKHLAPVVRTGAGFTFPAEMGLPGRVTAPNITSHPEAGIGAWTDGEKLRAIREGIGRDGRALFPMMPYESYRHMSDRDAEALVAYMNTLPAAPDRHPPTAIDFPVSLLMKSAPAPVEGVVPEPAELGEYLVRMGGCADCHTPKERGAPVAGKEFAGGEVFRFGQLSVVSANLTPDVETGIGRLTEAAFIQRFQEHRETAGASLPAATQQNFTVMPWLQFSQYSSGELGAIYRYLRKQRAVENKITVHPRS
jgi:mono/diheme cytochrome c family protein